MTRWSLKGRGTDARKESKVAKSCGLCDSMDCSLPASFVHGIFQARILEWVAISFSRGFSNPGTEPRSPSLPKVREGLLG